MAEDIITTTEAARIYKRITGRRRSPKCVEADAHTFRHLGCFDYSRSSEPKLAGIYRGRWEYFVGVRLATRGLRNIFSTYGLEGVGEKGVVTWTRKTTISLF